EAPAARNTLSVQANGPNYLRGDLAFVDDAGTVLATETRVALCRCGGSQHKPYCDGSHRTNGFQDPGVLPQSAAPTPGAAAGGRLTILAKQNGPIKCVGALTAIGGGRQAFAEVTFLCRCGHSGNKPYCDGTHKRIGFRS